MKTKNKPWQLGYKVLKARTRTSCFLTPGAPGCLEYPLSQIVRPKPGCGPLALFSDTNDAIKFLDPSGNNSWNKHIYKIVRCKYLKSNRKFLWITFDMTFSDTKSVTTQKDNVPAGTIFADEIICLQ